MLGIYSHWSVSFFNASSLVRSYVFGPDSEIIVRSLVIDVVKTVGLKPSNQNVAFVWIVTTIPLQYVLGRLCCRDEIITARKTTAPPAALGERFVDAQFKGKRKRQPKINAAIFLERPITNSLFADAALPAFFGAVLAILTILAGMAGVGTGAGRCENVGWNLIDEQNRQQKL